MGGLTGEMRERHTWRFQLLRFVAGGLTTTVLCWGLLIALKELGHVHYLVAANVAGFAAYGYAYVINKYFVFRNRERRHLRQGSWFVVSQVVIWLLANAGMYAGVDVLKLHYFAVTVIIAVLAAGANFLLMKFVVFFKPAGGAEPEARP